MFWWDCCHEPPADCERFYDDFEREAIGDDWVVDDGNWSLHDDGAPHGKVLTESGTSGALIYPTTQTEDDDQVVGYAANVVDTPFGDYGIWVKWTGIPRIIVNLNITGETFSFSHVDIHTGDVTSTFKMYQDGEFISEHAIDTPGMADTWVLLRVAFGRNVDSDHKTTLSIGLVGGGPQDLAAECQQAGYYVCLNYDAGARYCGLGNGGDSPVYFSDFSLANYDILGTTLCGPCDCNCENHCVPWDVVATFTKVSNSNPNCEEYDGTVVELPQVGHDNTPETPCPDGEECHCWWHKGDLSIKFCGEDDYEIISVTLARAVSGSLSGASKTDFGLSITGTHLGVIDFPLIEEESTCKPLKLVFGPVVLEFGVSPPCCGWTITITE